LQQRCSLQPIRLAAAEPHSPAAAIVMLALSGV
jgi:hypothetical protein